MENQSLVGTAKNSKGSIIAGTLVGLAVVGGAATSLTNTPQAEEPIKAPAIERSVIETEEVDEAVAAPIVQPAAVPKTKTLNTAPVPKTPAPTPKPLPAATKTEPACSCPTSDLDCKDFSSGPAAQSVYSCCLKQGKGDYHDLDRDSDGTACDTLW